MTPSHFYTILLTRSRGDECNQFRNGTIILAVGSELSPALARLAQCLSVFFIRLGQMCTWGHDGRCNNKSLLSSTNNPPASRDSIRASVRICYGIRYVTNMTHVAWHHPADKVDFLKRDNHSRGRLHPADLAQRCMFIFSFFLKQIVFQDLDSLRWLCENTTNFQPSRIAYYGGSWSISPHIGYICQKDPFKCVNFIPPVPTRTQRSFLSLSRLNWGDISNTLRHHSSSFIFSHVFPQQKAE